MHYWKNKEVDYLTESELRNALKEAINEIDRLHQEKRRKAQQAVSSWAISNER